MGNHVRIGVKAPDDVSINRPEVWDHKTNRNQNTI